MTAAVRTATSVVTVVVLPMLKESQFGPIYRNINVHTSTAVIPAQNACSIPVSVYVSTKNGVPQIQADSASRTDTSTAESPAILSKKRLAGSSTPTSNGINRL